MDQTLIALSATRAGVSIISFVAVIGAPAGIASASLTLFFSLATGIIKKLSQTKKEIKRRNIIRF